MTIVMMINYRWYAWMMTHNHNNKLQWPNSIRDISGGPQKQNCNQINQLNGGLPCNIGIVYLFADLPLWGRLVINPYYPRITHIMVVGDCSHHQHPSTVYHQYKDTREPISEVALSRALLQRTGMEMEIWISSYQGAGGASVRGDLPTDRAFSSMLDGKSPAIEMVTLRGGFLTAAGTANLLMKTFPFKSVDVNRLFLCTSARSFPHGSLREFRALGAADGM